MYELIPMQADATGLILTAQIPGNAPRAIIGVVGPQAVAESYDCVAFFAKGDSPLVGDSFRFDALVTGDDSPFVAFPGPGVPAFGIPGSAFPVEAGATVQITLATNSIGGGTPSTATDSATFALVCVELPLGVDRSVIPLATILAGRISYSVGTITQAQRNIQSVARMSTSRIRLLKLQARKTNTGTPGVLQFGNTNAIAITRQKSDMQRLPIRGRINTRSIAGSSSNQIAGLTPGLIELDFEPGTMITFDMLDTGDGVASAKNADFVAFGYEYAK